MSLDDMSRRFFERRKVAEGHDLNKFYRISPEMQFVTVLATGFLKNHFYMKGEEVLEESKALHLEIAKKEPEFHLNALEIFRTKAFIKDQILIGLAAQQLVQHDFDRELALLKTMPPKLILRWINFLRTRYMGHGYSHRQKRLVERYLQELDERRFEYYAMRYLQDLRTIIRLTHPSLQGINHDIAGWIVTNRERRRPATERLKAYEKLQELKEPDKKLEIIDTYDMPFEIIRSTIPVDYLKHNKYAFDVLRKVMTPSSVVFNIRYLQKILSKWQIMQIITEKLQNAKSYVSSFDLVRAAQAINDEGIQNKLYEIAEQKTAEINKLLLENLKTPRVTIILDVSGSMFYDNIHYTSLLASLMMPLVDRVFIFSDDIEEYHKFGINEIDSALKDFDEISGGTNMASIDKVLKDPETKTVFLFSDEQENATEHGMQVMDTIRRREKQVFVFNPSPYPAHAVDVAHPLVHYIPATTPETLIAALRLSQLYDLNKQDVKQYVLQKAKVKVKE